MAEKFTWFRTAANNSTPAPDGFPELMARSGVNDSAREVMASEKRAYDEPDFRRPFQHFTLSRISGTQFTFTDVAAIAVDASLYLEVGQRIKANGDPLGADNGNFWEGFVDSVSYADPITTFEVVWIAAESTDVAGPTAIPRFADTGNGISVSFKELGTAAWSNTGTGSGELLSVDDVEAHVFTPESTLDVGFMDGESREEISMAAARGRLNPNGATEIWSRGEVFDATTPNGNNADDVCADNFTIISDGNDRVDISRDFTDPPPGEGTISSMLLTAATVPSNEKHGVMTFAEAFDAYDVGGPVVGKNVSASFWVRSGPISGISAIRAYLVFLRNAAPATTPVTGWGSGTAGSNVTFDSTDWSLPASGGVLAVPLTTSWVRHTITAQALSFGGFGAGAFALALIVDDATISSGAQWRLGQVQVNRGDQALPFIRHPYAMELERCQRYFQSSFDTEAGVRPGDGQGADHAMVAMSSGSNIALDWRFRTKMFKTPTIVTYNPRVASPTDDFDDGANQRAVTTSNATRDGAQLTHAGSATDATVHRIGVAAHANIWGNN